MAWLNLKEWATLHGLDPRTARKLITDGMVAPTDYIHNGRLWRVKAEAKIVNYELPKCKNFIKEVMAV